MAAEPGDGPPDVEAIARAASADSPEGARTRRLAMRARERRDDVRPAAETAQDHVSRLAGGLVDGTVEEAEVLAAVAERDRARRLLECWELAVRELDGHPALAGRR